MKEAMTYSHRAIMPMTAAVVTRTPDYVDIRSTEDDGIRVPVNERTMEIMPGAEILLEVSEGSTIAGLALARDENDWLFRKTDAVLFEEHRKFVEKAHARWGWS